MSEESNKRKRNEEEEQLKKRKLVDGTFDNVILESRLILKELEDLRDKEPLFPKYKALKQIISWQRRHASDMDDLRETMRRDHRAKTFIPDKEYIVEKINMKRHEIEETKDKWYFEVSVKYCHTKYAGSFELIDAEKFQYDRCEIEWIGAPMDPDPFADEDEDLFFKIAGKHLKPTQAELRKDDMPVIYDSDSDSYFAYELGIFSIKKA